MGQEYPGLCIDNRFTNDHAQRAWHLQLKGRGLVQRYASRGTYELQLSTPGGVTITVTPNLTGNVTTLKAEPTEGEHNGDD
jgi:hypothetical protein